MVRSNLISPIIVVSMGCLITGLMSGRMCENKREIENDSRMFFCCSFVGEFAYILHYCEP